MPGVELILIVQLAIAVVHDAPGRTLSLFEGMLATQVVAELVGKGQPGGFHNRLVTDLTKLVDTGVVRSVAQRIHICKADCAPTSATTCEEVVGCFKRPVLVTRQRTELLGYTGAAIFPIVWCR